MTYQVEIGADGRTVTLPLDIARELGLQPGSSMAAEIDGTTLRFIRSPTGRSLTPGSAALDRLRRVMAGYTLDDFLRDRRRDGEG